MNTPAGLRIVVLGATGTAGRAAVRALCEDGHEVVCLVRADSAGGRASGGRLSAQELTGAAGVTSTSGNAPRRAYSADASTDAATEHPGESIARSGRNGSAPHRTTPELRPASACEVRTCDVTDPASLSRDGFRGEHFDVVVSCLASRTGTPADAWAIDHAAHITALAVARSAGVSHFILLSAICVQKPRLAFQRAKLAFEAELIASGLRYSIVRPTALFKSLSGQIERVRKGKPYLLFGDGTLTSTKPISDTDLGRYIADCICDPGRHNRILPIGGPGAAVTPRQQGEEMFRLLGRPPRFRRIPVTAVIGIANALNFVGRINLKAANAAEFARIAHYYATESMLVLDRQSGQYSEGATPSFGTETLFDHYAHLISSGETVSLREHAVF